MKHKERNYLERKKKILLNKREYLSVSNTSNTDGKFIPN